MSGYNRAEVMQKSCRCTWMYGELTEKEAMERVDRALDHHLADQFEILLYKKNRECEVNTQCPFLRTFRRYMTWNDTAAILKSLGANTADLLARVAFGANNIICSRLARQNASSNCIMLRYTFVVAS